MLIVRAPYAFGLNLASYDRLKLHGLGELKSVALSVHIDIPAVKIDPIARGIDIGGNRFCFFSLVRKNGRGKDG